MQGFVFINSDESMIDANGKHAKARNTNLNEDLGKVPCCFCSSSALASVTCSAPIPACTAGNTPSVRPLMAHYQADQIYLCTQVSYVFSDKTGTLTSNEMQLRQIAIRGITYGSPQFRCVHRCALPDPAAVHAKTTCADSTFAWPAKQFKHARIPTIKSLDVPEQTSHPVMQRAVMTTGINFVTVHMCALESCYGSAYSTLTQLLTLLPTLNPALTPSPGIVQVT